MTKKNSLVWRLPSKLTLDDIEKMISLKIITAEEAKELTFNTADENEKVKALEEQVDFLKDLLYQANRGAAITPTYIGTFAPPRYNWTYTSASTPLKLVSSVITND